jgi:predicted methyltransferase
MLNLDYHDLYWQSDKYKISRMDPDAWLKTLYDAMKPGGIVGLIDHAAAPGGDTRDVVEKYHRIDPATARADFERAGFVVVGSSDMLANPADAHDLNVFDEKIRGKTDRFILKLKKPAK